MESKRQNLLKNKLEKLRDQDRALRKENKSLQRALRDNVTLLRDFPGGMVLVQEGEVILMTESLLNQLGYTEEEILGRNFLDFVHTNSLEHVRNLHEKRIAGKSVPDQYETCLSTRSSEPWCCEVRVKKIRYRGRRAFLVNVIGLDQRKQREMQLRQSAKMEALTRMATGLSREFSTCLPVLAGDVPFPQDMEATRNLPPPLLRQIESARETGNLIAQQLRCLTKKEYDYSDFALLDLKKIVKDAVGVTRPKWKEDPDGSGVKINVKTYLRTLSPVEGHPMEIRDAFVGMIANAIDALPHGGEIYLTTEESSGLAHAYIQDNGVGIPDDIKDKIFDPFFTTKKVPRLGLGLSLAQAIIHRHGGEIEFTSQEGQGATFIVKLPLAKKSPSTRPRRTKNRIKNSLILIVAGDGIIKELLSQLIQSKEGKTATVSNVMEGLKILKKNKFDLIIADLDTPELEPRVLIPRMKKTGKGVPIVLVNAEEKGDSIDALRKLGADIVVGRPLNMPRILSLVSEALAMRI